MTTILAMDTVGPSLSVALTRDGRLVYQCTQQTGRTHSERLMPLVDAALGAASLSPKQVDLFAVTRGPGSFTGVRIGVATAKALAHATDRPCVGVNALEALARAASLFPGIVCPLQDARAGQVYCAAFRGKERILPDAALPLSDFLALLPAGVPCCFVGDGAAAHATALPAGVLVPPEHMALDAVQVAAIALERIGEAGDWRALLPFYLRAPQAERERAAREAAHA